MWIDLACGERYGSYLAGKRALHQELGRQGNGEAKEPEGMAFGLSSHLHAYPGRLFLCPPGSCFQRLQQSLDEETWKGAEVHASGFAREWGRQSRQRAGWRTFSQQHSPLVHSFSMPHWKQNLDVFQVLGGTLSGEGWLTSACCTVISSLARDIYQLPLQLWPHRCPSLGLWNVGESLLRKF